MKIRMRNTIQFDEQLEVIDQLYDVEVHEKGDYSYLLFYNEEKEKVVIKFHGQELVMSRFSNPKTFMRFLKDSDSLAYIPTPMGMQEFIIQTSRYEVDGQKIHLDYQLQTKRDIPLPAINWKLLGARYDWGRGYSNEADKVYEIKLFLHIFSS